MIPNTDSGGGLTGSAQPVRPAAAPTPNTEYVGHRRGTHPPEDCSLCQSYLRYLGYSVDRGPAVVSKDNERGPAVCKPNCLQGYAVYNRHENCPYSLMCAVCDIDDEQQRASPNGRSEP